MAEAALMTSNEVKTVLQRSELFGALSEEQLEQVVPLCEARTYSEGELLITQGQRLDALYILVRGMVGLVRHRGATAGKQKSELTVEILGPGRICGWSALASARVATLSARAVIQTDAVVVDGHSLRALLERSHPMDYAFMKRLVELLGQRLRQSYSVLDGFL